METENRYSETDLGNVSLNPRGEYDPGASYEYLDTVSYQGGSYMCLAELETTITGIAPDPGHNTDAWQVLTLPGDLTPEYIAMHDDTVNRARQAESSRLAAELAQQATEDSQTDVQQLHTDTRQAATEAGQSRDSAAGYAQSAEASRKAAAESEQNINAQMTGLDQKVSESVSKATGDIATARQQAIDTITTQEAKSTAEVKRVGTAALDSAKQASQDIKTAGQQAVRAITDQQNISVQAVKDETKNYIEEKKQEISDKTDEVTQAVEQAGEKQLQNIANSLDNTLTESGKAADSKAVGDAITLIEENKANKSALATTDRKLDALWKLNQGITYEFQTDNTEAYQKTIPTGAKVASVKQIGGKTIVWNQLLQPCTNYVSYNNAYTKVSYEDDCAVLTVIDASATNGYSYGFAYPSNYTVVPNHKYYICASLCASKECTIFCEYATDLRLRLGSLDSNTWTKLSMLYTPTDAISKRGLLYMDNNSVGDTLKAKNMMIVDLTKMFGAGNEPSTVEEFEAMFPEDYYPYNEGTLLSMSINEMMKQGRNLLPYPYKSTTQTKNGLTFTDNGNGTITVDGTTTKMTSFYFSDMVSLSKLFRFEYGKTYELIEVNGYLNVNVFAGFYILKNNIDSWVKEFVATKDITSIRAYIQISEGVTLKRTFKYMLVEKKDMVTAYTSYKPPVSVQIPQAILDLPGYGWSAGDICNEVDWENKKYIQRVTAVDLGSLNYNSGEYENHKYFNTMDIVKLISPNTMNTLCKRYSHATANAVIRQENMEIVVDANGQLFLRDDSMNQDATLLKDSLSGVVLYYELAEPIITDISDILTDDILSALEVEPGGTLTFQNSNGDGYKVPVPNTVEYAVKLSEIGGTTE